MSGVTPLGAAPLSMREARSVLAAFIAPAAGTDAVFEANVMLEEMCGIGYLLSPHAPNEDEWQRLCEMAAKRLSGFPLQYIIGHWPFMGLELEIGEGVLIPRQDTEDVCLAARELWRTLGDEPRVVLDLCAGSGAIAAAMKSFYPAAKVRAVENSSDAFVYLEKNAKTYSFEPVFANVFDYQNEVENGSLCMVISNPPYLTESEMQTLQTEVEHEPPSALFGGEDGLRFYRHIAAAYKEKLRKGGVLVFEVGYQQSQAVAEILTQAGYENATWGRDLAGNPRFVHARR